jgi:hypothetical protein
MQNLNALFHILGYIKMIKYDEFIVLKCSLFTIRRSMILFFYVVQNAKKSKENSTNIFLSRFYMLLRSSNTHDFLLKFLNILMEGSLELGLPLESSILIHSFLCTNSNMDQAEISNEPN